jgi:hypothetical protein
VTNTTHGLQTLKNAVKTLGSRTIDRRTRAGRDLALWRENLIADLGGWDAVSTQRRVLVGLAVMTKLQLDSVDAWILKRRTLVDGKRKALLPVVRERLAIMAHLQGVLRDLGLERQAKAIPSLDAYLKSRETSGPKALAAGEPVDAEPVPAAVPGVAS